MRKNIKKSIITTLLATAILGTSMTAYAAPKTMPDGQTFDAEYYAETYPDVKAALGTDEAALYNHYVTYGKAEGRQPYADKVVDINDPNYVEYVGNVWEGRYLVATGPDITPQMILDALRDNYVPTGSTWDQRVHYMRKGKVKGDGSAEDQVACGAFAFWLSDAIFGDVPAKKTMEKGAPIHLYDIVLMDDGNGGIHAAFVTGINPENNTVTVAEANYHTIVNGVDSGGKVRWGGVYNANNLCGVITRY